MFSRRYRGSLELPRQLLLAALSLASLAVLSTIALSRFGVTRGLPLGIRRQDPVSTPPKSARTPAAGDEYLLGVGKADITGPVVEINFAGYASLAQVGTGLRQRVYSRAFIIGDVSNPSDRFIYVNIDTQGGDTAVRNGIIEGIQALGPDYAVYGAHNIAVVGTHSHSGPGGWFNYLLPQVTSLGFDRQSYQAIVTGAVLSVQRAHESLTEVKASWSTHCCPPSDARAGLS